MRDRQRQAGQLRVGRPAGPVERQRHQGGARRDDAQPELARDAVAEIGGADLRDRQAAGGDDHVPRQDRSAIGQELIARARCLRRWARAVVKRADRSDGAGLPALDAAGLALAQQHLDEVLGRSVAEQLALVLLVEGDAVSLHQRDEVLRRVARQGRAAEVRVVAQEVLVRCARVEVAVGEVAAPAARDADLLGDLVAVVDQQDLKSELAGHARAEQAGRARADDDHIELHGR